MSEGLQSMQMQQQDQKMAQLFAGQPLSKYNSSISWITVTI